MEFVVKKNNEKGWDMIPTCGTLEGVVVGRADAVLAVDVRFAEDYFVGKVKAVWGLVIVDDQVYGDRHVIRDLGINRAFKTIPETEVVIDRDGFKHRHTMEKIRTAQTLMVMGRSAYVEGAQ